MLDQLEAISATEDGAWIFPQNIGGQNAALVAWWFGGALRNLSFVTLPAADDRAAELKNQLAHIIWSGELEGWLTAPAQMASGRGCGERGGMGKSFAHGFERAGADRRAAAGD